MYLPLASLLTGGVIAGAEGLRRLTRWPRAVRRRLAIGAVFACAIALSARTIARNEDYRIPGRIWQQTVLQRPDNARAHNNLGVILGRQGHLEAARAEFTEALRLQPEYLDAKANLALLDTD